MCVLPRSNELNMNVLFSQEKFHHTVNNSVEGARPLLHVTIREAEVLVAQCGL